MHHLNHIHARILMLALVCLLTCFGAVTRGQEAGGQKGKPSDETLRIDTELVQTNVMVFDKRGQFVDGLKREQFELRVDGHPVPVTFFEQVANIKPEQVAGRSGVEQPASAPKAAGAREVRGRTIVFFIDDLHLSLDSLGRTRAALNHFMDEEMTAWDQVAFVSSSGQIGFLQQLTDNKAVLRAALARLRPIPYTVRDTDTPPMPDYVALRIANGDRDAADLYIDKILEGFVSKRGSPRGFNRNAVFEVVKTRANHIVYGMEAVTANSLASLESLVRMTQSVPGRKLIFFISDGFYIQSKDSVSVANTHLQRVTDAATRTGSVIYTIDARGLFALLPDATGDRPFDPKGRLDRATVGESVLSQDGLNALAGDTGGRFLKNQNYFDRWVARMLDETSNYYVLAWRPETEAQKVGKYKRVEVSVAGRPELNVRMQRGYFAGGAPADGARQAKAADKADDKAGAAMGAEGERHAQPISGAKGAMTTMLNTSFVDVPGSGPVLTSSVQVSTDTLDYGAEGKQAGAIDLGGVVLNDQGKQVADFKTRLNVTPLPAAGGGADATRGVIYNHRTPLAPGLYLIKVAARDGRGGQVGSAAQWIEIPDLSKRQLTLSSLLLGGTLVSSKEGKGRDEAPQVQFSVDRHFARTSRLSFMLFIYNAAQGQGGASGLTTQVQVMASDGRVLVDSHTKALVLKGTEDQARIPYAGSFPLQTLAPGRYVLRINVADAATKTSATQQSVFFVE